MSDETGPHTRTEHDTLGEVEVPADALYGAQTARAIVNFPLSGWKLPPGFLAALATIKAAFARAHRAAGLLPAELADVIAGAADAIASGEHLDQFPIDVFQTGSGTSTNMNMNEVIAHLANRKLGGDPGAHTPVHPNDHVNMGQSSNDVIPAAMRIAALTAWRRAVAPALEALEGRLDSLAGAHAATVTLGRTHLMDAVPTTYGRIFGQWADRLREAGDRCERVAADLCALPLGGTAVGTGIGSSPGIPANVVSILARRTGLDVHTRSNPAVGIAAQDAPIAHAGGLAGIAQVLMAISNDLRLRSSGPFGGIGELRLPAVQPGSSIMPGKINPVIPEAVTQVAIEVQGLAAACGATAALHQFDLSHANPLLAWNLDTMAQLLANASRLLADRCLCGLEVDVERARAHAAASPALATALAGALGYERAAQIAKAAEEAREPVGVTAHRLGVLPEAELDQLLDLDRLAGADPVSVAI
ncbi:MAG: aspartate ammonia-lyase [Acidobacteria bacterium]|nr:aspartate ammonia-lyase [Acidobacteriota bacterium]